MICLNDKAQLITCKHNMGNMVGCQEFDFYASDRLRQHANNDACEHEWVHLDGR